MFGKLKALVTGGTADSTVSGMGAAGGAGVATRMPTTGESVAAPSGRLDPIRFAPEKRLLDELFERFGLEDLVTHIFDAGELVPIHHGLLAQQVRLTPLIAPRLFALLDRVRERLAFGETIDLYVFPSDKINALAMHRLEASAPHAVCLASAAIREMTDDELCFVLGHEIGHLHYRHARVLAVQHSLANQEEPGSEVTPARSKIPQLLERRLDTWSRQAELSVDRAGFLAAGESVSTAVACFYKMASGLGPDHLRFDLQAFLAHLERLEQMPRKEVMAQFSHPVTPVRARALQLFAGAPTGDRRALEGIDEEVSRLTGLMEFEASTDLDIHARQFLLSAGLLAAQTDGSISEEEKNAIVQLLLQVTGDPEGKLASVESVSQAERMLEEACAWLSANSGQERFALFGQIVHIVALDGSIAPSERTFVMNLAARLGIPERAAREVVHQVLARYVRSKNETGKFGFGLTNE